MKTVFFWFLSVIGLSASPAAWPQPRADWKIELIAAAPQIRHPSVVCAAPDGRVFVAEDPMDIRAPADSMQGRIICFHPDGRRTVFAENLHAVFGMQYLEGKLYVLHNPQFSVFQDERGVGKDRIELIQSMNPNPWALDWNDHVPANFRLAMDGYFYIATGDKGVYGAVGRDGKRVDLHGGGILRMRPDGTALEIYATGVRNILDVALNDEDEIFTYDNTDEHDWMGRLTHMVEGGFYGYPHDFLPRRPYTLWMMHDFGGGAATGALCYTDDVLPDEYRGNLFLGDFGKRQVIRARIERDGGSYRVVSHEEMFANPPEDFRPVGICFGADGRSIYICDWQHRDTKEDVEVGRLWKLTFAGESTGEKKPDWFVKAASGSEVKIASDELIAGLRHPARSVRMTAQRRLASAGNTNALIGMLRLPASPSFAKVHALWALDAVDEGVAARPAILKLLAQTDPLLRRQAARQLGGRRVKETVSALREFLADPEPSVRFQGATALGRIGATEVVPALLMALRDPDFFARYSVFTALNRIGRNHPESWKEILRGLSSNDPRIREGTEWAVREAYSEELIARLAALVSDRANVELHIRETSLRLLAELHHQPPEWKGEWWAYHPALAAPPVKQVTWLGTERVTAALRLSLTDRDPPLRLVAVDGLRLAGDTNAAALLRARFNRDENTEVRSALIRVLGEFRDTAFADSLATVLSAKNTEEKILLVSLPAASRIGGEKLRSVLRQRLKSGTDDEPVLSELIRVVGEMKMREALPDLARRLDDRARSVRLAAQRAVASIGGPEALNYLRVLLGNPSADFRREGVRAIGTLRDPAALPDLLAAWNSAETKTEALTALAQIPDLRALDMYLDGLASPSPELREQSRKALAPLRATALPLIEARAQKLKPEVLSELRRLYEKDEKARQGPVFSADVKVLESADYEAFATKETGDPVRGQRLFFDETALGCIKCHAVAGHGGMVGPDLTTIGAQFPRAALIEHVLFPSRVVREGYQQIVIETRDGEEISGMIKSETPDLLTLLGADALVHTIPMSKIARRTNSAWSLMPEGLHSGLTLPQFSDLIAFLETRRSDPRQPPPASAPSNFRALFDGRDLAEWKTEGGAGKHWSMRNGVLEHDGVADDLWSRRVFENFILRLEWRWPDMPRWENFPLIDQAGNEVTNAAGQAVTERVLDAGDSGVFPRGFRKAQANLFCYPVGSGEVWEYRTDPKMPPQIKKAVTPASNADRPIGDWNEMEITLRGDRMSVGLNGVKVISEAQLPGIPERGPIGFQHEHGRIQCRNIYIRELSE